jgi:hypothetical protein
MVAACVSLAAIACGDEDEEAAVDTATPSSATPESTTDPAETASDATTPTPSSQPTAEGLGYVPSVDDFWIVFIRGDTSPEAPLAGEIWVSRADGSDARQIFPGDVPVAFSGLGELPDGTDMVYLTSLNSETNRGSFAVGVADGVGLLNHSYEDLPGLVNAARSADGRYIAHSQPTGLNLYDTSTTERRTLFESGSGAECVAGDIAQCYRAFPMSWSPDGRLLLVTHSVYEGGWAEVIDPFTTPPTVHTTGSRDYPSAAVWSPDSDAACGHGQYADNSGLYLLEAPEWEAVNLIPDFEDYTVNTEARTVEACDWLDSNTIAYLVAKSGDVRDGELWIYERDSGQSTLLASLPDGTACCGGRMATVPGAREVVTQLLKLDGNDIVWSQPALVDLETGTITHILQPGDIVVDAFMSE